MFPARIVRSSKLSSSSKCFFSSLSINNYSSFANYHNGRRIYFFSFARCSLISRSFSSSSFSSSVSSSVLTPSPSSSSSSSSLSSSTKNIPNEEVDEDEIRAALHSIPSHLRVGNDSYTLAHPIWFDEHLNKVTATFRAPVSFKDKLAYWTIQATRFNFDLLSGYKFGSITPSKCLARIMFLESIAGVPGIIAGTLRHCASLRNLRRDRGYIHTLLEEAENERMHLLIARQAKNPSLTFRSAVFISQGIFFNFYWMSYILCPSFCHRLVGYLEEQAVVTYDHILQEIDSGDNSEMSRWGSSPAPPLAINYWQMPKAATNRDMILRYRADEAHHREVNHEFADTKLVGNNPYQPGE